jgi:6-phosphofructokinase 1
VVEAPETIVGCMVAYRDQGTIETIPLHAVSAKPFNWALFARMHGSEAAD